MKLKAFQSSLLHLFPSDGQENRRCEVLSNSGVWTEERRGTYPYKAMTVITVFPVDWILHLALLGVTAGRLICPEFKRSDQCRDHYHVSGTTDRDLSLMPV